MAKRSAQGSGTIRKRADGRWEARYTSGYDPKTGKQVQKSVYGATQKEVRQKLTQITASIDNGTFIQPDKISVSQWMDIWMTDYCIALKPSTLSAYRRNTKNYITPCIGSVSIQALNPAQIQRMYNSFWKGTDGKQLSNKTVRNIHGILHKALQQAVFLGIIATNPCERCTPPRLDKKEINPLDDKQISDFLTAIKGHPYENVYIVDLFTGMRQSEILGLTWDCVNFEAGTIRIYRQLQLIDGKYIFTTPKNGKTRTIVPAPTVMTVLRNQRKQQLQKKLVVGELWHNDEDFVFTTDLGEHLARQTVYSQFKKIVASIGLPQTRFHDLRHSYAVASIFAGDDIKTVQENLGHHTAAFTLDIYGHVTDAMRKRSSERMEAFIKSVET